MTTANKTRRVVGQHRRRHQPRRQPYMWLGAGAVTFGVGAALASASGVAHAEVSSPGAVHADTTASVGHGQRTAANAKSIVARVHLATPAKRPGVTSVGVGGPLVWDGTSAQARHLPAAGVRKSAVSRVAGGTTKTPTVTPKALRLNAPTAPADPLAASAGGLLRRVKTVFGVVPIAGAATVSTPDLETGAVTGTAGFTVPTGLPLTYSAPTTSSGGGTVTIDASTGAYTYTPTSAMWLAAANTPTQDSFTVTASDGLATTTKTVTLTVGPPIKVTATIPVGETPSAVGVSPDGSHVYVTNFGKPFVQAGTDTVSVIDTATNNVTTIVVGNNPQGLAVSPDGSHVYITNYLGGAVSVIDTATNTVSTTIPVGSHPYAVAVSPDGSHVYVPNYADNTVSVIDTATNTVSTTIAVGNYPGAVAVSPDGNHVYVTNSSNFGGDRLSVIDTATNTVSSTIRIGTAAATAVAVSPDGNYIYVTGYDFDGHNSGALSVIDTATKRVSATIPVGELPTAVAVSPDGSHVYVTNSGDNTVSVFNTVTNTVTTIPVAGFLGAVAVSPDGSHLYVTNADVYGNNSDTVSVISL